jgi:hypothetical protein
MHGLEVAGSATGLLDFAAMFATLPRVGIGDGIFLLLPQAAACDVGRLLGMLNALSFDYIARQKLSQMNMSFFLVEQFPVLPSSAFKPRSPSLLVTNVVELAYTSWDIKAFPDDIWRDADDELRDAIRQQWEENRAVTGGHEWSPPEWAKIAEDGIPLPPFKWGEDRRAILRAELDAYYAKFYGLNRKQLRYILDPHGLSWKELENILDEYEDPTCSGPHLVPAESALDFPGETFRVLKDKEERQYGEYRTRRLVLEAWERLHAEGLMPEAYDVTAISGRARPVVTMPTNSPSITEDDQTFPWDGRERFVYECIPHLIALRGGREFEYYRSAAIMASRPDDMRALLEISRDRQCLADFDGLPRMTSFPADQKIRPGEILEGCKEDV